MKNKIMHFIAALAIMILAIGGSSGIVLAEDYTANTMRLLDYEGTVEIERPEGTTPADMKNVRMESGEAIVTGDGSRASIGLDDSKVITLDENSRAEFTKGSGKLELKLTKGQLLFDVQEKLKEDESFDIKTSTMVIGIRGTIGVVSVMPVSAVTTHNTAVTSETREITSVMITEGVTDVTLDDGGRNSIEMSVPAGQMLVVPDNIKNAGVRPSCITIKKEYIAPFFLNELISDENLRIRSQKSFNESINAWINETINKDAHEAENSLANDPLVEEAARNGYPADTEWEFVEQVELIAQSASKLYDGTPLTRPGDVLVDGLPEGLSIEVSADGSRTDAGVSSNPISKYTIRNSAGKDVTDHFKNVVITEGSLVVDPAPLVVWTGSASKVYDGTPLTNPNAGIRSYPGHEENQPLWRNMSYIVGNSVESTQAQVLYGICGTVWVHGTNPLTADTIEKELKVGEKLTVYLSDENGEESIRYEISSVSVNDLPDEVIRVYANNPEMMKQACLDAGWDQELIEKRIQDLLTSEDENAAPEETVQHDGLTVNAEDTDSLMRDCTNVRINIDTSITDYNDRALSRQESHYTPINIDESIKVTAVGSRTYVGYNKNNYTIDWGNANRDNYILYEELGTLRVYAKEKEDPADPDNPDDPDDPTYDDEIVITASSASKTYNGKPLTSASVTVSGLPSGFRLEAAASGSQTDAGTGTNRILSFKIYDSNGKDVTSLCTNVNLETGNLTVNPATLTITTNSDEKIYDGTPLTASGVEMDGLAQADKKEVTAVATGSITDKGSAENSYSIDWGNAKKGNYTISDKLGTLTVTPVKIEFNLHFDYYESTIYTGYPYVSETIDGLYEDDTEVENESFDYIYDESEVITAMTATYNLKGGGKLKLTADAVTDAGEYTVTPDETFVTGKTQNYEITYINNTITIAPIELEIRLGYSSSSSEYNGYPIVPELEDMLTGVYEGEMAELERVSLVYEYEGDYPVSAIGVFNLLGGGQLTATLAFPTDAGDHTLIPTLEFSGDANKENYYIIYSEDTKTITPVSATLWTSSDEKVYDGKPLTSPEAGIDGITEADEEKVIVTGTGSITEVGEVNNTYTINWGGVTPGNYVLEINLGTLKITEAGPTAESEGAPITIEPSGSVISSAPKISRISPISEPSGIGVTAVVNSLTDTVVVSNIESESKDDPETVNKVKEADDPEAVAETEITAPLEETEEEEKEEENIPEEDKDDENNTQEAIVTEPVSTGEPDEDN